MTQFNSNKFCKKVILGYFTTAAYILLIILLGSVSDWTFTGDYGGAILMVYAFTLAIPHFIVFVSSYFYVMKSILVFWDMISNASKLFSTLFLIISTLFILGTTSEPINSLLTKGLEVVFKAESTPKPNNTALSDDIVNISPSP
ncbi:hypothetical protein PGH07_05740 [Sulfurovum sp. zt1-1]|uniref:Uncharacterized protein n=1 Tax=Sulfurovum zhangzhouensis TaxID=3019067 RepID=A0ABT7QXV6_9BACT|nr:hypothetical protein [Sulfurovum zhangzhouensis]MDM5271669.1 hypothetical protein [Sulfurovum zhangzhouensis]